MDGSMSDSKIVNLSLGETKKDGNLLSFLLHSAAPKKNKAAETKKKETPPHHLTSGHSIQVQSQHSTCFSLAFLLTSTTRTPWHQIR